MAELSEFFKEKFLRDENLFDNIIGNDEIKNGLKSALLSGRHIIIIGAPGIGKTTLAKDVAAFLPDLKVKECGFNCIPGKEECPICKSDKKISDTELKGNERFVRIQGSSDLTVEDIVGQIDPIKAMEYGPYSIEAFTPGKIFRANRGVLFFDEINRAPEKVQNSLLQVLEENEITLGSYRMHLPVNFVLIATMNPEDSSTEKLSDVFIDRFDMLYMNYPKSDKEEKTILVMKEKQNDIEVVVPENYINFIVAFVRSLRLMKDLEKKPSVRATLGLYERAKANAFINRRKAVTFKDIEDVYISVICHRIRLNPSVKYTKTPEEIVKKTFEKVAENFDLSSESNEDMGDSP